MQQTGLIILAAGASRRLGQAKQLVRFRGKPLLQHIIDTATAVLPGPGVVVLGAHAPMIERAIQPGKLDIVFNNGWPEGIASSLREGLALLLKKHPDLDRILILLADQPFVSMQVLTNLIQQHDEQQNDITACRYGDVTGVPAIFSSNLFPKLAQLKGDRGAGSLIWQHSGRVGVMPFEAGAVDIDTPDDYQHLWEDDGI